MSSSSHRLVVSFVFFRSVSSVPFVDVGWTASRRVLSFRFFSHRFARVERYSSSRASDENRFSHAFFSLAPPQVYARRDRQRRREREKERVQRALLCRRRRRRRRRHTFSLSNWKTKRARGIETALVRVYVRILGDVETSRRAGKRERDFSSQNVSSRRRRRFREEKEEEKSARKRERACFRESRVSFDGILYRYTVKERERKREIRERERGV